MRIQGNRGLFNRNQPIAEIVWLRANPFHWPLNRLHGKNQVKEFDLP
jgi:hypothetical protein